MTNIRKYLPVLAALVLGAMGAAGYAVHAAGIPSGSGSTAQVQTTAQDPENTDGEVADDASTKVQTTAQDPQQLDGEQADDAQASASTSVSQEAESGPADTGPDNGEAD